MIMNISLTPQLEEFVKSQVSSGMYNNASEVIREALRDKVTAQYKFGENDIFHPKNKEWLEAQLQKGLDDIEHGRVVDWNADKFISEMKAEINSVK